MGGMAARWHAVRAALRLARRDAWRNRGRSALIAVMVALPVLAASTVSVLYRSDQREPQDIVRVELGTQVQASLTIGDGTPTQQTADARDHGVLEVVPDGSDPQRRPLTAEQFQARARAVISARNRIVIDRRFEQSRAFRFEGRPLDANLREFEYWQPGVDGLVDQVSGRAPAAADEVVVSQKLAEDAGIKAGDRLSYAPTRDAAPRRLTTVGVVGGIPLIGRSSVIGPPGGLIPAGDDAGADLLAALGSSDTLLVAGPDPVTWDQVLDLNQLGSVVLSRAVVAAPPPADRVAVEEQDYGTVQADTVGIAVVVIGLVLLQIALLAGPAIAVGARRNERTLAIMVAAGAERRHLRTVVLATSGVIGLASCAVAAVVGAGLGAALVLLLRHVFEWQVVRVDVHPLDLVGLALVGGATAVLAALIPARQAARLDVVGALTGRRSRLVPRLGVPVVGLLIAAAGAGLAFAGSQRRAALMTVSGLALTELGLVAAAGAMVALTARFAVRLPFAPRFALRDAARQRGRTAPAVAAVLAAIAGGSTALVFMSAQARYDEQNYLRSAQLGTVRISGSGGTQAQDFEAAEQVIRRTLPIDRVATYHGAQNEGSSYAYLYLTPPPPNRCPIGTDAVGEQELEALSRDPRCTRAPASPASAIDVGGDDLFDDGSTLAVLTGARDRADVAALKAGRVLIFDPLLLWPDGTVRVTVAESSASGEQTERTVTLPARLSTAETRLLSSVYPLSAARALGVKVVPKWLLASTTRMPTTAEQERAEAAAREVADVFISVERGFEDSYAIVLLALVAAAAVVTLGGTFTAVGLAAAEGRADVATLAAIGAGPGVRRRLAASQAGVIAGLGAVLGVASGVLAGWMLVRMQRVQSAWTSAYGTGVTGARWELALPWTHLLATGLGMPLLAMVVAYLTTRSRLPLVRRLNQ